MPVLLAIFVVLALVAAALIWLTFSLFGFLVTLVVAAIVGWLADAIVPGDLPFGWLGAIAAGLLGAWLGTLVLGRIGPDIGGIPILPALVGAIVVAFVANWITKASARRTA